MLYCNHFDTRGALLYFQLAVEIIARRMPAYLRKPAYPGYPGNQERLLLHGVKSTSCECHSIISKLELNTPFQSKNIF